MKTKRTPPDDDFQIRCPRLGHQISFSYCRVENMGRPCFKVLDCWHEHFAVAAFLQEALSPEEWEAVCNRRPPQKMLTLVELIEQAKKRTKDEE
jgi:hypothetical protein